MSKRLQVLLDDQEYKEIARLCRRQSKSVASWVRERLQDGLAKAKPESPEVKIAKILKYARFNGPTGDIEDILSQIDAGKKIKL